VRRRDEFESQGGVFAATRQRAREIPAVDAGDLILVSVDDHVVEPPDMFEGRLPAKLQPRAPRVERLDDGTDAWVFEGETLSNIGLNAVAGRPPQDFSVDPLSFEDMRSGCWDSADRVRDMNAGGVLGSMCFPTFVQFCGQLFSRTKDRDLASAVIGAYNDWHVDTWCASAPGRFIPLGILPMWDAELMAAEVRRLARKGCHAVTFSENPYLLGLPTLHSDQWDPFWKACQDEGTVVCLHIGSSSQMPSPHPDAPMPVTFTLVPLNLLSAAADLLWSPVMTKFPEVKIALSEGGIGWIPYFLERVDYVYGKQARWLGIDFGEKLPSDLFREHFISCFIEDEHGLEARNRIGVESICWESDYPHSDSTWPYGPESLTKTFDGLKPDEIDKITHLNAMRHFQYDPFATISREDAKASALRELSVDVDVTFTPPKRNRPSAGASGRYDVTVARGV
jgi:predicted TIM-barrel fold metal-dependent hydrolase